MVDEGRMRVPVILLSLHDKGQPAVVYEITAKRIIEAAKKGERDPIRLRDAGLAALGHKKEGS
jgi:hypothetical protein